MLKRPHGEVIGSLGQHFGLEMDFKFNEVSTGTFSYPKRINGRRTIMYDQLINGKLIQMDPYGVYVVTKTEEDNDGVRKVKEVTINSLEQELVDKKVIFAEGTYNFWNPADVENTILGMTFANVRNWKIGDVATSLLGKYRTFAQTDADVLSFCLETLQETYGCVFLFDTYTRTVNVLDAEAETVVVPVYLSHQNLIEEEQLTEDSDSLFTKFYVSGAEGVDIRDVNPTGDSYIYNLDYFISTGDISGDLAKKYHEWQNTIFARQSYYTSLVALRNSAMARYTTESAKLTDLQNELSTLNHAMATFADMLKKSLQAENRVYFEERAAAVGAEAGRLENTIAGQKVLLEAIQSEYVGYLADIAAINKELNYAYYFTDDEKDILDHYLKETDFTDTTFAAFNVDSTDPGGFASMDGASIQLANVTWWDVECEGTGHSMGVITGGALTLSGNDVNITAEIINATIDHSSGSIVCSFYLGKGTNNGAEFPSGNLTCVGTAGYDDASLLAQMTQKEDVLTSDDGSVSHTVYYYTGSPTIEITSDGSVYFTRNVTEYQRYSVQQELYEYASEKAKSLSAPTYMFELECGNILYEKHFEAFKNAIQLGCAVYLQLENDVLVKPILLEMHVNFEDPSDYQLVFANTFQRPDKVNLMKDILAQATAATKQLDINRHNTFQNNNTTLWVDELLKTGYNAALNRITAGPEQSVVIDGAGITVDSVETSIVGPDGEVITVAPDKIVITNGMIALVERDDTGNETVKMAMGHFYDDNLKSDFVGVLADVICGTLVAGKNLIIECPGTDGEPMQFKVDSTGVTINNGRIYLRSTDGLIALDPNYGFMASDTPYEELFVTDSDTGKIYPVCYDTDGKLVTEKDENGVEFPKDVTVLITKDGHAYFKGDVYANNGYFSGHVEAQSGSFKGVVNADDFQINGVSVLTEDNKIDGDYLDLRGVTIVDEDGNPIFYIDESGIHWSSSSSPVQFQYAASLDAQEPPANEADKITGVEYWHTPMVTGDKYRRESYDGGVTWSAGYLIVAENGKDGEPGQNGNNVQYQYSNNQANWYDTYFVGAVYRRDSTDGGQTWEPESGYKFVGTDATVTYENVKKALNEAANAGLTITTTRIGETSVETPTIKSANLYSSKIYGTNIYAGDGTSDNVYANMNGNGFYVYHTDPDNPTEKPKLSMVTTANGDKIQIIMGAGGTTDATSDYGRFCIEKVYVKENDPGNGVSLIYHGSEDVGFTFNHDGTITVHGEIDGLSPVAVFGE